MQRSRHDFSLVLPSALHSGKLSPGATEMRLAYQLCSHVGQLALHVLACSQLTTSGSFHAFYCVTFQFFSDNLISCSMLHISACS